MRSSLIICLFSFTLFSQNAQAQSYGASITFTDANGTYSFDYTIVCGGSGTTAILTVDFTTATPPGLVRRLHLGGGTFVDMVPTGTGPYTYELDGFTLCEFSFFFYFPYASGGLYQSSEPLTPVNTPLPITITNFSVTKHGTKTATLDWKTSAETNSDYFGIERSIDGENWEAINQVRAAGNSNTDLSYSYMDTHLRLNSTSDAIFYYRLKLTDLDDSYHYSRIRSVKFVKNYNDIVSIYPNPTIDRINVDLTGIDVQAGSVQLRLYNGSGREVMIKKVNSSGTELLDMTNFPAATYYIIVQQGTETIYQNSIIKGD